MYVSSPTNAIPCSRASHPHCHIYQMEEEEQQRRILEAQKSITLSEAIKKQNIKVVEEMVEAERFGIPSRLIL